LFAEGHAYFILSHPVLSSQQSAVSSQQSAVSNQQSAFGNQPKKLNRNGRKGCKGELKSGFLLLLGVLLLCALRALCGKQVWLIADCRRLIADR
jgi:hypothetical protein